MNNQQTNQLNPPPAASPHFTVTPQMKEQMVRHVHDSLKLLPASDVEAYREAQERCPDLIQQESNPLDFLSCHNFHVLEAAFRLAMYWKIRKQSLGKEAAFKSLEMPQAVDMAAPVLVELPVHDAADRRVIYLHYRRPSSASLKLSSSTATTNESNVVLMKTVFALLSSTRPVQQSQYNGQQANRETSREIVLLINRSAVTSPSSSLLLDPLLESFLSTGMPWTLHKVHVVCCLQQQEQGASTSFPSLSTFLLRLTSFHVAATTEDLCSYVQTTCGLTNRAHIPVELGGTWNMTMTTTEGSTVSTAASDTAAVGTASVRLSDATASAASATSSQASPARTLSDSKPSPVNFNHHSGHPASPPQRNTYDSPSPQLQDDAVDIFHSPLALLGLDPHAIFDASRHLTREELVGATAIRTASVGAPGNGGGSERNFIETVATQQEGLRRLEEAMDVLPDEDKAAYLAAVQYCSYLVHTESDPTKFLRYEKYNAWAAAKRLASYWTFRVQVFGSRAFLPMTLTGNGALTPDDVEVFRTRNGVFFPPKDTHGRTVVYYDPDRRHPMPVAQTMRLNFYCHQIVMDNEVSISDGYVLIMVLGKSSSGYSTSDGALRPSVDIVLDGFPVFAHKVHLVNSPIGLGQRIFYEVILPVIIANMQRLLQGGAVVHTGTKEELMIKLGSHGLPSSGLPDVIGGQWPLQNHLLWTQERMREEQIKFNASGLPALGTAALLTQSPSLQQQQQLQFRLQQQQQIELQRQLRDSHRSNAINHQLQQQQQQEAQTVAAVLSQHNIATNFALQHPTITSMPVATLNQTSSNGVDKALQTSLAELEQAIKVIPADKKAAYLQAATTSPELIERESNPTSFLRHEGFDPVAAARRLVRYWEVRQEIFEKRAFMPLDQTGEGALDRRDLAVLGTGYIKCLPKEAHGRAALFCDGTRLLRSTRQSRLRSSFYMYSIAAECQKSQLEGFVLIYVMTEPSFDRANKECLDLVLSAIPACIRDIHLLRFPAESSETRFLDKMDPAMLHQFRQIAKNQVVPHLGESRMSLGRRLEPYGFERQNLPKSIGGGFGIDRFIQWQDLRIRYEWDLPAGASLKEEVAVFEYDFSRVKLHSDMTEDEKHERKRKLNVIHSRRKRERERIEAEVLHEQCQEQKEQKKELQREHERLKKLIAEAHSIIRSES